MKHIKTVAIFFLLGVIAGLVLWGRGLVRAQEETKVKYELAMKQLVEKDKQLQEKTKKASQQTRVIVRTITRPDGTVEKSKERIENKTKEFSERAEKEKVSTETEVKEKLKSEVRSAYPRYSLGIAYRDLISGEPSFENLDVDVAARIGNLPLYGVIGYDASYLNRSPIRGFRIGIRLEF
jgi:rhamnose utilization protein RhaD (predicted bifunctional aldolase and dehydrogenase)